MGKMDDLIITVISENEDTPYPDMIEFENLSEIDLEDLIVICRKAGKEIKISFKREEKCEDISNYTDK